MRNNEPVSSKENQQKKKDKIQGELIIALIFFTLSISILVSSIKLPASSFEPLSPGTFPQMIMIFMFILSVLLILEKKKALESISGKRPIFQGILPYFIVLKHRKVFTTFAFFIFYIVLMKYIGFRIATFSFLLLTQASLCPNFKRYGVTIFIISLILTLGSFYFFQNYLGVIFPMGLFFE